MNNCNCDESNISNLYNEPFSNHVNMNNMNQNMNQNANKNMLDQTNITTKVYQPPQMNPEFVKNLEKINNFKNNNKNQINNNENNQINNKINQLNNQNKKHNDYISALALSVTKLAKETKGTVSDTYSLTTKNIILAFTIISALAWNDAIKFYIGRMIKLNRGNPYYYLYYALIITVITVIFARVNNKINKNLQKVRE